MGTRERSRVPIFFDPVIPLPTATAGSSAPAQRPPFAIGLRVLFGLASLWESQAAVRTEIQTGPMFLLLLRCDTIMWRIRRCNIEIREAMGGCAPPS
jgi:hypothetical protein